jgi:hypothetical protein
MACPTTPQKIDSNGTGLRYAFELCIGNLPSISEAFAVDAVSIPEEELGATAPTWHQAEPNSYGDFGASITTTPRTPITAGRQREKGVVTDLDASAGFQIDFTLDNFERLAPTFFFAAWRRSDQFGRSSQETITDITSNVISGTGIDDNFVAGDIVLLQNLETAANNTINRIASAAADEVTVAVAIADDASPPANAYIKRIGVRSATGDVDVDASLTLPALTSTTLDFTTLGLIPGQWVYLGGDTAPTVFSSAANNGFARVFSVAANRLTFDKTQNTMITEANTTKTVEIYFGDLIKNEADPTLIKVQSVQLERSLATAGYEYVRGCVANQFTLNVASADKITADLAFVGTDAVATEVREAGTFPVIDTANQGFNTSSDFSRIRLANKNSLATPLFAFITDLSLVINNNVTPTKAVGTLGAFDVSVGDFTVTGNVTAYFSDVAAINAVRNNADVTFDFVLAAGNQGWVFDIPLVTLGEGRLSVEKDTPITLPLSLDASRDPTLNSTLVACYFPYLPTAAQA